MPLPPRLRRVLAAALPVVLLAALALAALAPALAAPGRLANRYDWRYFESMAEVARRTVVWYHEVPLWNPYSCGGEVGIANPQSLELAPTFLLILLFGTALGGKLALAVYLFAALDGARRLGRWLGLQAAGSLLAAVGFGLSGYLGLRLAAGHAPFVGVCLFPYLLLCFDRSLDPAAPSPVGGLVGAALVLAWIALLGGTFTPPMAAELLLLWAGLRAVERRSLRPFAHLGLVALAAFAVAAIRMLPVLEFLRDHPRPAFRRAPDASTPWQLLHDLTAARVQGPIPGRKYWAHEYGARLPLVVLAFAVPALALAFGGLDSARRRALRAVWLLAAAAALLALGNFAVVAPWSLLQRLPVLRDLRVPSRHLVLLTLALALAAGFALDAAQAVFARRGPRARIAAAALAAALVALAAGDGARYVARSFRGVYTDLVPRAAGPARFYHVEGGWREMRGVLFAGHGCLVCDEEAPLQRAQALDRGDVPQARLHDPAAGAVLEHTFTPNRRRVVVELREGTILVLNSNWNEHWRSDRGRVTSVLGRLAVDLGDAGPGRHVVTLVYRPRSFVAGAVVSGLALPALVGAALLARRRARRRAVPAAAPPVLSS